jgi:general stress protein YciG
MNTHDTSAAAATLGRKGGQSTSQAKADAARKNGQKGGRPKKKPAPK